jgi:hypothetical protein
MRLSADRIGYICSKVCDALLKKKLIKYKGSRTALATQLARVIMTDLIKEDEIDAEVERMIESMKRRVPRYSAEWNSIFMQKKEELAKRRNYVL